MTADELSGGVNHDVGAVLNGTHEVGGAESIVDDKRNAVTVSYLCNGFDVEDLGVGVAKRLGVEATSIGSDGSFEGIEVAEVDDGIFNALCVESVGNEVEGTAIEVVGSDDMRAGEEDILERVGDGSSAGSHGESGDAPFEGGHTAFEDVLSGVCETAVDVPRLAESETVGSILRVSEHVGSSLVYRHSAGIGGRVGLLLSGVELDGLEVEFVICSHN